ncbi:MAG TPA: cytochrome P450 [Ktedonobacteraceae bacterium]|nr:cytochrome P450 [Ktedonobacteraceae bacterium]
MPVHTLDPRLNPFPEYKTMRESQPVRFNEMIHMWDVYRYDDVQRVLTDAATFSSEFIRGGPFSNSLVSMDPPRHRQLRNIVTQAFTPRTIAQLAPRITAIVNSLLDAVQDKGAMDVINDFAYPLPVTVIAELIGIPTEDLDRFRLWSNTLVSMSMVTGFDPQTEMGEYFQHMIEQRRKEPKNDLISALIAAQIDGEHLNMMELLGFCFLLLVAGNETTTNLIGNAFLCFHNHSDSWQQLQAEPTLIPSAIEEVVRYLSPVQSMFRVSTTDTIIGDQKIPAGSRLLPWIGSANRDETQFPNADTFDMRRSPNRHIAFGHGIHFCIGAPLARLEAKIAFETITQRLTNITLAPDATLERTNSFFLYGVEHFPVTFTPQ